MVVVDLGIDKLYIYKLKDGVLVEFGSYFFVFGVGFCYIVFYLKEKYVYVMIELSNEVIVFEYNLIVGEFREI